MPTQPTNHQPKDLIAQDQSDCIYFWGPPTAADQQKYIEKLDEEARLREVWRREMIKGTYWMREIVWQLDEANEPLRPVEIVNPVTNRFRFACWKDKFDKRVELLKEIGVMVNQGRLGTSRPPNASTGGATHGIAVVAAGNHRNASGRCPFHFTDGRHPIGSRHDQVHDHDLGPFAGGEVQSRRAIRRTQYLVTHPQAATGKTQWPGAWWNALPVHLFTLVTDAYFPSQPSTKQIVSWVNTPLQFGS